MQLRHRSADTVTAGMSDGTVYEWRQAGQAVEVAPEHVDELLHLGFVVVEPPAKHRRPTKTPIDES